MFCVYILCVLGQEKLIGHGCAKFGPRSGDASDRRLVELKTPVKPNRHKTIDVVSDARAKAHKKHCLFRRPCHRSNILNISVIEKGQELQGVIDGLVPKNLENATWGSTELCIYDVTLVTVSRTLVVTAHGVVSAYAILFGGHQRRAGDLSVKVSGESEIVWQKEGAVEVEAAVHIAGA